MSKSNRKPKKIYLDYAASAFLEASNPGAIHEFGVKEKNKLEKARAIIANILDARKNEIIFTSGATESNNLAVLGLVQGQNLTLRPLLAKERVGERWIPHIITTNIEHASVLEVFRHLEETKQAEVTYVEVENTGIVDFKKIKKSLKPNTVLVSVMYANNEIGTIQPIMEIAKEIRYFNKINSKKTRLGARQVFFHTDATQAINYLPVNVSKLGVDMMSWNGAKIYGPKGIGALFVKKGTPIKKIMFGGDQEFGLRPGTENTALAVELAKDMQVVEKIKEKETKRLTKLRDYFLSELSKTPFGIIINGDLQNRLPNNVNITFPKIPSDLLVVELSARGIMTSSKSACKSSKAEGSYVINAIRSVQGKTLYDGEEGGVRFSLGRQTTKKDIDYTVRALGEILTKLKKWYD
jgi:cysteine desulfurase